MSIEENMEWMGLKNAQKQLFGIPVAEGESKEDLEYALNDGRPYYKSKPRLEMRF